MVVTYLTVGVLWILLMSILRIKFLKPQGKLFNRIRVSIRIPKINSNPNEIMLALFQAMGFLWLLLGIFWAITERILATSMIGVFAEGFGIFLPPILGVITLRLLTARIKKKSSGSGDNADS